MPQSKRDFTDEQLRTNAEPYDWSKSRLTDDEVREFALGIYRNEIFTEYHIRESDLCHIGMIFLPLALGMFSDNPEMLGAMEKSPPGMCYARYVEKGRDQTFPRSVNGYPIFSSCAFLSKEDTVRVHEKYNQIKEALDSA